MGIIRYLRTWVWLMAALALSLPLPAASHEAAFVGASSSSGSHHDRKSSDEPPAMILRADETLQFGKLISSCWISGNGERGFTETCGDGPLRFPRPKQHLPGQLELSISMRRGDAPIEVSLDGWRLDNDGRPVGPSIPIQHTIERAPGKRPGYQVHATDFLASSLFLQLGVTWTDQNGGGHENGTWTFYLRSSE